MIDREYIKQYEIDRLDLESLKRIRAESTALMLRHRTTPELMYFWRDLSEDIKNIIQARQGEKDGEQAT